ncbi:MAG: single-stranded DNA-binding protein [Alphaproteobacteria bacterium]|nr:single-stranded DNA-binding protein [Rickettsiales bacterium]
MINKAILIGNVGNDPEIKTFSNGSRVVNFSIATSESWKNKEGDRQERTEWHRITVYPEALITVIERYVKKGSKLYIEGSIRTRKYNDQSGAERYTTEIVLQGIGGVFKMLDSKNSGTYSNAPSGNEESTNNREDPSAVEDDIPF